MCLLKWNNNDFVILDLLSLKCFYDSGGNGISSVASMGSQDGPTWREDHPEDNHDGQEDEGVGYQGDLLQVAALQRS